MTKIIYAAIRFIASMILLAYAIKAFVIVIVHLFWIVKKGDYMREIKWREEFLLKHISSFLKKDKISNKIKREYLFKGILFIKNNYLSSGIYSIISLSWQFKEVKILFNISTGSCLIELAAIMETAGDNTSFFWKLLLSFLLDFS